MVAKSYVINGGTFKSQLRADSEFSLNLGGKHYEESDDQAVGSNCNCIFGIYFYPDEPLGGR